MGLGDKAAALALSEGVTAANPIEKDALIGPWSLEILARVAAQMIRVSKSSRIRTANSALSNVWINQR
jgi:hypothetical protein